jgi:hypothetical protein
MTPARLSAIEAELTRNPQHLGAGYLARAVAKPLCAALRAAWSALADKDRLLVALEETAQRAEAEAKALRGLVTQVDCCGYCGWCDSDIERMDEPHATGRLPVSATAADVLDAGALFGEGGE